jgi:hypothetical protein
VSEGRGTALRGLRYANALGLSRFVLSRAPDVAAIQNNEIRAESEGGGKGGERGGNPDRQVVDEAPRSRAGANTKRFRSSAAVWHDSIMKVWRYFSRGYAILCIVTAAFVECWNHLHPGRPGIPVAVRDLLPVVIVGIAAFPIFALIQFILWALKREGVKPTLVSVALFLAATAACLLGVS